MNCRRGMCPPHSFTALSVASIRWLQESDGYCPLCGDTFDSFGDHALTCMSGGDRTLRHNAMRDMCFVVAENLVSDAKGRRSVSCQNVQSKIGYRARPSPEDAAQRTFGSHNGRSICQRQSILRLRQVFAPICWRLARMTRPLYALRTKIRSDNIWIRSAFVGT